MARNIGLYVGLLAVSTALLALEVLQVRIFSVMMWHHLAYMVITVALLGFGAAGAYVAIKGTGDETQVRDLAGVSGTAFGLSYVASFMILTRIPLDSFMANMALQGFYILLYYVFLVVPFFFGGLAITLVLSKFVEHIHKLYFTNLVGSALGCLLVVPLLWVGGENGLLLGASLAVLGSVGLYATAKKRFVALGLGVVLLLLLPISQVLLPVRPAGSKAMGMALKADPNLHFNSTQWDPIARIDSVSSPEFEKMPRYFNVPVDRIFMIDGDAFTMAMPLGKTEHFRDIDILGKTLYASAYFFKDKPEAAVIGLGGGTDIMTALHFDAKKITGVEINQAMIDAARDYYQDFKYNPYEQPSVTIVREEGRSYLRRTQDTYDIIQMSGVDTWSALMTGAYVLSENYLYTMDAYHEYFDRLKPDGILSKMRWVFNPPRECLRIITQITKVLQERGVEDPSRHIIVLQQELFASVLAKKSPFTDMEVQKFRKIIEKNPQFTALYYPGMKERNAYSRWFEALHDGLTDVFLEQYPYNIEPVDDDSPFFFKYYKWSSLFQSRAHHGGGYLDAMTPIGFIILLLSLIQAVGLALAMIIIPLWMFKRKGLQVKGTAGLIVFFSSLGLGFMFLEISLMQRFVLFVGHPTYAITTTLFALMVFAGIGSMIAGKLPGEPRKKLMAICGAIFVVSLIYMVGLGPLFQSLLGLPLTARIIIAVATIAPLGLLLGMPFPTGLKVVGEEQSRFVPWAWGINGAAGVTASVLSVMLAMATGFTFVLAVASLIYLSGGIAFLLGTNRQS